MFSRTLLHRSLFTAQQRSFASYGGRYGAEEVEQFLYVNEAEFAGVMQGPAKAFETRDGETKASFLLLISPPQAKNQIQYRIVIANPNMVDYVLSIPSQSNVFVTGTLKYRKKDEKVYREVECTSMLKLIAKGDPEAQGENHDNEEYEPEDKRE